MVPSASSGVAGEDRADVVLARNVGGGQHRHDTVCRADLGEVELAERCVRDAALPDGGVEGACRGGQVVDVERLAAHMQGGAVMGERAAERQGFFADSCLVAVDRRHGGNDTRCFRCCEAVNWAAFAGANFRGRQRFQQERGFPSGIVQG